MKTLLLLLLTASCTHEQVFGTSSMPRSQQFSQKLLEDSLRQKAALDTVSVARSPLQPQDEASRVTAPQPAAPAPSDPVEVAEEEISFGRPSIRSQHGLRTVLVEVTNNRSASVTCTVTATFKKGDTILGVAEGVVNDLPPGGTKTADLLTEDRITGYDSLKLEAGTCVHDQE